MTSRDTRNAHAGDACFFLALLVVAAIAQFYVSKSIPEKVKEQAPPTSANKQYHKMKSKTLRTAFTTAV